jgi:hypothetical protein
MPIMVGMVMRMMAVNTSEVHTQRVLYVITPPPVKLARTLVTALRRFTNRLDETTRVERDQQ